MKEIDGKPDFPGAAAVALKMQQFGTENSLRVFNGDFLGTSALATMTKGGYGPEVLNALGTDLAIYGNHEFDYGSGLRKAIGHLNLKKW